MLVVTLPYSHLDLTPPEVRISSSPPIVSSRTSWTFQFRCVNEWMCAYMCSLYPSGSSAPYTPCSGSRLTGSLQNGRHIFAVYATDGVGNIGNPVTFQWTVGKKTILHNLPIAWSYHLCNYKRFSLVYEGEKLV